MDTKDLTNQKSTRKKKEKKRKKNPKQLKFATLSSPVFHGVLGNTIFLASNFSMQYPRKISQP